MKLDIIDEVTVHQCELKVGHTCTTLWVSCFNEGCEKICRGGLFNGSEVLMSTCIYKQNRGRWRLQMLIYGAVSIALYRDMDEFDCVHIFNIYQTCSCIW